MMGHDNVKQVVSGTTIESKKTAKEIRIRRQVAQIVDIWREAQARQEIRNLANQQTRTQSRMTAPESVLRALSGAVRHH